MTDERRYELLQEIGRGAMGIVYKAIDRETSEVIALKILKPEVLQDKSLTERFKNELRIARKITHKNVCRMYEFTRILEGPCISMEYVEGETVRSLLKRIGAFSLPSAFKLVRQLCSGLREAHSQGVAHRDLKPENLMIDRSGNIKIMDFGVARVFAGADVTTFGSFAGTPAYMAPEQVECREIDQRSDIYALGLILYEMVTGTMVFRGESAVAVAYKQVHEAPPAPRSIDPNIPENVQSLILRCIEKEPERRFQTVDEVEAAITQLGYRSTTTTDTPTSLPHQLHNTTFIIARKKARWLMLAVQALYFTIYAATLYYAESAGVILETDFHIPATLGVPGVVILAMCGIASRIYLTSALVFDHPDLPKKFRRLFPALWLLDTVWAASPILLLNKMPFGIALGCVALMVYIPFSQKTLMENMTSENPRLDR